MSSYAKVLWSTHRPKDETAYNDTENRNVFGIFLKKIKKVSEKVLTK